MSVAKVSDTLHTVTLHRGSASRQVYGFHHFMDQDVVMVSINYRLSVLGNLYLDRDLAPGNQALRDQIAGLQWVRDNMRGAEWCSAPALGTRGDRRAG